MTLCCAVWDAFVQNVRLANDDALPECTEATCMSAAHMGFVKTELDGAFDGLTGDGLANADLAALGQAKQAELFVHALIGRHFAAVSSNDVKQHAFVQFDSMRGAAHVVRPLCSFERTVYLSIIVLTIVVLITVIVLQMLRRTARARAERDVVLTVPPDHGPLRKRG